VRCEEETVRYAELEARADRLARELCALGVTPGARVGVCLPRSIDFIVALYAALKAGAAYVPLDPEHPRPRLAGLVDDARLAALITRRASLPALDSLHPAAIACDDIVARPPGPRIRTAVHPESPAYVIYTSGSTGTPKGVVVSHRALDNYVAGITARMALPAGASMAMVSTVAADLGHTALFGALCTGGTLHLISDERAGDPDGFADYMTRHRVAALKIVPGHLWGLMQTADPDRALPAEVLVIGGEAAPPPLLPRDQPLWPHRDHRRHPHPPGRTAGARRCTRRCHRPARPAAAAHPGARARPGSPADASRRRRRDLPRWRRPRDRLPPPPRPHRGALRPGSAVGPARCAAVSDRRPRPDARRRRDRIPRPHRRPDQAARVPHRAR
jgi:non-ribosomal peptide synthetase component F